MKTRTGEGETPGYKNPSHSNLQSFALGAAVMFMGGLAALAIDRNARTELETMHSEPPKPPLVDAGPPPQASEADSASWSDVKLPNKWQKLRAWLSKKCGRLLIDHNDPLAHFAKTLWGSVGMVFILFGLAKLRWSASVAEVSLELLKEHISSVPASAVNLAIALAGFAALVSPFRRLKWIKTCAVKPFSEFTLHLLVIGVGASVGTQLIYLFGHLYSPAQPAALVSLVWLCVSAIVVAMTISLVIEAPENLQPKTAGNRFAYATCGALVAILFIGFGPVPDQIVINNVFAAIPELHMQKQQVKVDHKRENSRGVDEKQSGL
ncbi:hypothetical protein [Paraburkholderia caribensis]|uniref:hypothetical protein n=1 Tax=Paraburkholderia caribensis TaxID=75105 RepID=UPI0015928E5E|nr:hypothetical protein [Paraburkholderia caribensis]